MVGFTGREDGRSSAGEADSSRAGKDAEMMYISDTH